MKIIVLFIFLLNILFAAEVVKVDEQYQKSTNCKTCHKRIVDEWSNSWHAKGHFAQNEYFNKSMEYMSKKTRTSLATIKVGCASCHSPRISVTEVSQSEEMMAMMGLGKGGSIEKAVNDDSLSEGVNCVVCHNIDKIHDEYDSSKLGIDRVEWTPSGTMTGPYSDAKSPYHKTIHHDFMDKTPNRLCFVCHANIVSTEGLEIANMQQEYQGDQACVECHMGEKRRDVAATYSFNGEKKYRDVRNHGFTGAHQESMWKDALKLSAITKSDNIELIIQNPQPHNIPSGFGGREIIIDVTYKDNQGSILQEESISLTTTYKRKMDREAFPVIATKKSQDLSIPAKGQRNINIKKMKDASLVDIKLSYRLVNDELRTMLDLKEPIWSKKFYITQISQKL